ncbi:MAG: CHAD domain-containing protein [Actinomycetes bacterium]
MIEVEDKFRVHADFELPALHSADGPVTVVSTPRRQTLTAVYYDTEDLRLARVGVTVRHRSGEGEGKDGWTLKLPVTGARTGVREELHEDAPAGEVPARFRTLLTACVRRGLLEERATVRTERTAMDLLGADGQVLAEVVDDRVDALTADHHVARFREIEVEDRLGGSAVLDHVGGLLRDAGAVAGEFQPKVVRALGPEAGAPPSPPAPAPVTLRDPASVLVASTLRTHVRALLDHDPWARLGADDAVHQMRVSARRLRSALRDLADLVEPSWGTWAQDELRWLGAALSTSRNAEVLRSRLEDVLGSLDPDLVTDRVAPRLFAVLDADATEGHAQLEAALSSDRYLNLLEELVDAATQPRTTDAADSPCSEVAPGLVRASWRRLAKRAAATRREDATEEQYHRARIAAKRTRYLAESLVPVYGRPAKRFARRVEAVQEVLGEHQDTVVARALLHRAATEPRVGRAAFTFGVMYCQEEQAARSARSRFQQLWPKLARARHRRWIDR